MRLVVLKAFKLTLSMLILIAFPSWLFAQTLSGFDKFIVESGNIPRSAKTIKDPTGTAPTRKVFSFSLKPAPCATIVHTDNHTDCTFSSLRSQLIENPRTVQSKEVWTAWSLYLPSEFAVAGNQSGGGMYTFAYFHNTECPNVGLISDTSIGSMLYLQTNIRGRQGDYTCLPDQRVPIVDLKKLRGAWHRFELYTKFSSSADGRAEVYLDGKLVAALNGHTITVGAAPKNFFVFGVYLCCNKNSLAINSVTGYYAGLSKAKTRDGLKN